MAKVDLVKKMLSSGADFQRVAVVLAKAPRIRLLLKHSGQPHGLRHDGICAGVVDLWDLEPSRYTRLDIVSELLQPGANADIESTVRWAGRPRYSPKSQAIELLLHY